jgi:hypothetical protein
LSKNKCEELKRFIDMNQKAGKIRLSTSPFALPFLFHLKPGTRELHRIQDYWRLNDVTVKDWYLLPLILEVITKVTNSACFTKMDLRWGFTMSMY